MGIRAHLVAKPARYAGGAWFNYQAENLIAFLDQHEIEYTQANELDCYSDLKIFDVVMLQEVTDTLRTLPPEELNPFFIQVTNEELVETFDTWLKHSACRDTITIHWF